MLSDHQRQELLEIAQELERIASGSGSEPVTPGDRMAARCWVTIWRLEHGDAAGARETR